MAKSRKAIFIVLKYPYNHPAETENAPVGSEVDLSHLTIQQRQALVDNRLMRPTVADALLVPDPEPEMEPPKLNRYGKPFGQGPDGAKKAVKKE